MTAKRSTSRARAVTKRDALTDKERLFIEQYFICGLNGTEAALAVYDTTDRNVAANIASTNLSKPKIRARVNERLDQFHLSANEVLARMAMHARGSMAAFIDPDSGVLDLARAKDAADLGLIKRYRTKQIINSKDDTETLETEIEMYDAQAALRDIAKHLGLFQSDTNININLTNLSDNALMELAAGKKPIDVEAIK